MQGVIRAVIGNTWDKPRCGSLINHKPCMGNQGLLQVRCVLTLTRQHTHVCFMLIIKVIEHVIGVRSGWSRALQNDYSRRNLGHDFEMCQYKKQYLKRHNIANTVLWIAAIMSQHVFNGTPSKQKQGICVATIIYCCSGPCTKKKMCICDWGELRSAVKRVGVIPPQQTRLEWMSP